MPQTTLERAARWPGGDAEAMRCLEAGGWELGHDWVYRHVRQPTKRERDAALYLMEEWEFAGLEILTEEQNRTDR